MRDSHNQTITQQEDVSLQTANLRSQGAKRAGVQGTTESKDLSESLSEVPCALGHGLWHSTWVFQNTSHPNLSPLYAFGHKRPPAKERQEATTFQVG